MDWLDSIIDFVSGIGSSVADTVSNIGPSLITAYNALGGTTAVNLMRLASASVGTIEQLRRQGMSDDAIQDAIANAQSVRNQTIGLGRSTYEDVAGSNIQQLNNLAPSVEDTYGTLTDDILGLSDQLYNRGAGDIDELGGTLDTAINERGGALVNELGTTGSELIDFATSGAEDQRRALTPAIQGEATKFQAPDQYSDEGIRGVLGEQALRGVNDAYRDITDTVSTQAVRSGQPGGKLLEALAKQRSKDTSDALLNARVQSIGAGQKLNQDRKAGQASNIGSLTTALANRENIVPQAYNVGGSMKLGSTQALLDALGKSKLGQVNAKTDLNKTLTSGTIGGTADAGRVGGTLYNTLLSSYGGQNDTNTRGLYSTINTAGNNTADTTAGISGASLLQNTRYDAPFGNVINTGGNLIDVLLRRNSRSSPYRSGDDAINGMR